MIKRILIANRSEIACRIIKTCKKMGIETVAVYSDIDSESLHTKLADYKYCIGGTSAKESYLNMDLIIEAAQECGADSIHPGYGFLSENPEFNKKVIESGLTFIGPNFESMALLGSKTASRELMIKNNVPVVPGLKSNSGALEDYINFANSAGYPVLIKAAAGGGGKGMRIVRQEGELEESIATAKRESMSAFGSEEVFIEKYIEEPRHIEFQVAGDKFGNYIHLFERECSLQRRHQKIIEESPSTALDDELRERMANAAINAVQSAGYDNIGTVEFLLDKNNNFYFLEVNARIQVEHPITEEVTNTDLVEMQINISNGLKLDTAKIYTQNGWAIECRIYAEDGFNNFLPSSGKILYLQTPEGDGIRYDSGIETGSNISVFYDPILAKLIAYANTREDARLKIIDALKNNVILGVRTSIPFMIKLLESDEFIKGNTYTNLIEQKYNEFTKYDDESTLHYAIAAASNINRSADSYTEPWLGLGKWEILSNFGE